MVDLFRNQTVTATALGDVTIGDAFIQGDFTANNLFADTEFRSDVIGSFTNGGAVSFSSPITVTNPAAQQVATFTYPDGAQTRYTDGTLSWDIGFDTSEDANFIIDTGTGDPKFKVSSAGSINSFNMFLSEGLTANTITATTITSSTFIGNLTGDVYAPGGTTKVFENGNGAGIPATFTGNVNGTVSSLTNHTTNNLTEGSNRLYFTTARARASFSAGTGVNISDGAIAIGQDVAITSSPTFADITAEDGNFSGTVDADKFTGDGSELTGIVQLLKGFITFNGSTGAVIASSGLTLSKSGTGNYAINISAGIRPPNSAYGVVIGNVDDGRTSVNAQRAPDSQTTNYNAFVSTRSSTSFTIRASKNYSTYVGIPSDDNIGQTVLGIQAVDPTLITALLVY